MPRRGRESGFATVQWVIMITFAMGLLVMITNVVAMQYARGAIRAAVDEGSRFGSVLGRDEVDCETRAMNMLRGEGGLLRGSIGDDVDVDCVVDGELLRATATGTFDWWAGGIGPFPYTIEGEAVIEEAP